MTLGANNIPCPVFTRSESEKLIPAWLVEVLRSWEGLLLRGFPANVISQGHAFLSADFFPFVLKSQQGGFPCWEAVVSPV